VVGFVGAPGDRDGTCGNVFEGGGGFAKMIEKCKADAQEVITSAGYGPGYKYFTHRLGHGIGLRRSRTPYLVRGSKTLLEPGMTFSNEPGIYVPGEFGLHCEDDMLIEPDGPAKLLTQRFAVSLEKPLG
jgi:Xaa-Pro dipeptidase